MMNRDDLAQQYINARLANALDGGGETVARAAFYFADAVIRASAEVPADRRCTNTGVPARMM